jgi:glycosyltransferase involved in cell wall biosynthesis
VLDCMNYGLPTIVNANGSMAELPADSVFRLPDDFDPGALVEALEILRTDSGRRIALGVQAAALLDSKHRPEDSATFYHAALDRALLSERRGETALLKTLAALPGLLDDDAMVRQLAANLARVPGALVQRQLLIDVTAIAQHDLMTGIERVVRTQLLELLRIQLPGIRVEPIYLSTEGNRWHYRYARNYAGRLLGIVWSEQIDQVIDVHAGDIFYSADYSAAAVSEAARAGVYAEMRARGVAINFMVHDLLPVLRPEFFPSNSGQVHARWLNVIGTEADQIIAISAAVRQELSDWYEQHAPDRQTQLKMGVLHHGADISLPTLTVQDDALAWPLLEQFRAQPTFLMVGTIEPRKGHLQAIAAFEELWRRGIDAQLVIVGAEGWKGLPENERRTIPDIVMLLGRHPELGKRLFWLQGIDDNYLQQVYAASICLLSPSEGEGFGLPLIEAARMRLPVIARDIPVFREVAADSALYFSGLDAASLADAVATWLAAHAKGQAPSAQSMRWSTWRDNATELLVLLGLHDAEDIADASAPPILELPPRANQEFS